MVIPIAGVNMTRKTKRPSREELIRLYTREGLTDAEIAERYGVNKSTVYRWKKHYGIKVTYGVKPQSVKGGK